MRKETYSELKEQGRCVQCGKDNPDKSHVRCPSCREITSIRRRILYQYATQDGVCVHCRSRMAEPGKLSCVECAEKDREYRKKRNVAGNYNTNRDAKRKRSRELKEKGLCYRCGIRDASAPGKKCDICRDKAKKYKDKYRNGLPRYEWVNYGICYNCGKNPAMDGKKVCESCYQKRLLTIPAMLQAEKDPTIGMRGAINDYYKIKNAKRRYYDNARAESDKQKETVTESN